MKQNVLLLLLFVCHVSLATASDEQRWYTIEMLLFANKHYTGVTERWPDTNELPDPTNTIELLPKDTPGIEIDESEDQQPLTAEPADQQPPLTESTTQTKPPLQSDAELVAGSEKKPDISNNLAGENTTYGKQQIESHQMLPAFAAKANAGVNDGTGANANARAYSDSNQATASNNITAPFGIDNGTSTAMDQGATGINLAPSPITLAKHYAVDEYYGVRPYVLLDATHLALQGIAKRLKRSRRYNVLHHISWRQPVSGRNSATWISLPRPKLETIIPEPAQVMYYDDSGKLISNDATIENPNNDMPIVEVDKYPSIDGNIKVSLSRFLHIDVDLVYRMEIPAPNPESAPPTEDQTTALSSIAQTIVHPFLLRDHRRMRSKELHYIDHPLFGILVKILRYNPAKQQEKVP